MCVYITIYNSTDARKFHAATKRKEKSEIKNFQNKKVVQQVRKVKN